MRTRPVAVDPALAATCEREYPRLVGLIALRVGDRRVAEELAQEALLRLCRRWSSVEHPSAWLTRVALNVSNSWLRRRFAEWRAYHRHGAERDEQHPPDTADAIAVRRAVAALPPRMQETLVLRFYEDLSVEETARVMACSEGNVKALTHRALKRLEADGLANEEAMHHA